MEHVKISNQVCKNCIWRHFLGLLLGDFLSFRIGLDAVRTRTPYALGPTDPFRPYDLVCGITVTNGHYEMLGPLNEIRRWQWQLIRLLF